MESSSHYLLLCFSLENLIGKFIAFWRTLSHLKRFRVVLVFQMEVKEKELMELKRERNFLAEQVRQLRSIQGASSDAKDAEIARLQEQEQELKGQIQDLAVQCRQLVIKQEEAQTSQGLQNDLQKVSFDLQVLKCAFQDPSVSEINIFTFDSLSDVTL